LDFDLETTSPWTHWIQPPPGHTGNTQHSAHSALIKDKTIKGKNIVASLTHLEHFHRMEKIPSLWGYKTNQDSFLQSFKAPQSLTPIPFCSVIRPER
jgi:hypothetical protein